MNNDDLVQYELFFKWCLNVRMDMNKLSCEYKVFSVNQINQFRIQKQCWNGILNLILTSSSPGSPTDYCRFVGSPNENCRIVRSPNGNCGIVGSPNGNCRIPSGCQASKITIDIRTSIVSNLSYFFRIRNSLAMRSYHQTKNICISNWMFSCI